MPSSVIRTYDYSPARRELRVIFQSGRRFLYHGVPEATYSAMRRAFSKGEFFNQNIRDRFAFTREDAP